MATAKLTIRRNRQRNALVVIPINRPQQGARIPRNPAIEPNHGAYCDSHSYARRIKYYRQTRGSNHDHTTKDRERAFSLFIHDSKARSS